MAHEVKAKWKRHPNRRGAARFAAYHTDVKVVDRETRPTRQVQHDPVTGKYEQITRGIDYVQIRVNGRLRWVRANEVVEATA